MYIKKYINSTKKINGYTNHTYCKHMFGHFQKTNTYMSDK